MVDFRNALLASTVTEVAPFPAGLNDCISGLDWVHSNASMLNIDPSRIVITGESGGGNLAIAVALKLNRDGRASMLKGVYAMCPFITGHWPDERFPSTLQNDGLSLDSRLCNLFALAYGGGPPEARDPLAWPIFASAADLAGLPPTVISVNECDPLRDEGVAFYRMLLAAGVRARGREVLGSSHSLEAAVGVCPEVTHDTARDIVAFAAE